MVLWAGLVQGPSGGLGFALLLKLGGCFEGLALGPWNTIHRERAQLAEDVS